LFSAFRAPFRTRDFFRFRPIKAAYIILNFRQKIMRRALGLFDFLPSFPTRCALFPKKKKEFT
jgi:hypothetical protein